MSTRYRPLTSRHVPASAPHPPGTTYRVSAGIEQRDSDRAIVYRIELAHHGVVAPRRVPSFPYAGDDAARVAQALEAVREEFAARLLEQQATAVTPEAVTRTPRVRRVLASRRPPRTGEAT
jgi:hypothetical protein